MELIFGKAVHVAVSGFLFGSLFKAFRLTDDFIRTGVKPALEDIAVLPPPEAPGTLQNMVREGLARADEAAGGGAAKGRTAPHALYRAGAFLVLPPRARAAPRWVPDSFLSAAALELHGVTARILMAALLEGGRTAKVLMLGTLVAGAVGWARHGRARYDRILDWQLDPIGASLGLTVGMYAFSPAEPRLGRAAIAGGAGYAFYLLALSRRRSKLELDDGSSDGEGWW